MAHLTASTASSPASLASPSPNIQVSSGRPSLFGPSAPLALALAEDLYPSQSTAAAPITDAALQAYTPPTPPTNAIHLDSFDAFRDDESPFPSIPAPTATATGGLSSKGKQKLYGRRNKRGTAVTSNKRQKKAAAAYKDIAYVRGKPIDSHLAKGHLVVKWAAGLNIKDYSRSVLSAQCQSLEAAKFDEGSEWSVEGIVGEDWYGNLLIQYKDYNYVWRIPKKDVGLRTKQEYKEANTGAKREWHVITADKLVKEVDE